MLRHARALGAALCGLALGAAAGIVLGAGVFGCTCTQAGSSLGEAPAPEASSREVDAAALVLGDAALEAELRAALAAKGPSYQPHTRHRRPDGSPKYVNRLIRERSPYLLQHAHNPVSWFPWGEEAFEVARKLERPVLLSVGYSTCHWCHVMAEETFEDEEIAAVINQHYVAIKVDREERPDIDAIYMHALMSLAGNGGWPMTVWLTPDKQPFFATTYLPARDGDRGVAKGMLTVLREQHEAFRTRPDVARDAAVLAARIRRELAPPAAESAEGARAIERAVELAERRFDRSHGGARGRPKFPANFPVRLLLRAGGPEGRRMALETLAAMQAGGIYDHVGGGFHRYAVDERWRIPHFEKMLYDNARLAVAYLEGYQATGDPELARVARETLEYVLREMSRPGGGYYSATDADSRAADGSRREGRFFTWTPGELKAALSPEQLGLVERYYGVAEEVASRLEDGRLVLFTPMSREAVAKELGIERGELDRRIEAARSALYRARAARPAPARDDKVLTAWNGLMISAMARGARVLGDARYRQSAERAAAYVLSALVDDGRLLHGDGGSPAFAEDYALLAAGLFDLFEAKQELRWLDAAMTMMEGLERHHRAPGGGYFRSAHDGEALLAREMEMRDGVVPAASSVAAMTALRLWTLTTDERWRRRAEDTFRAFGAVLGERPWQLEEMLLALDYHKGGAKEIALVLPQSDTAAARELRDELVAVLARSFVPRHVLVITTENAGGELAKRAPWIRDKPAKEGKVTAYVCERGACKLPTSDPAVFAEQLAAPLHGGG